MSLTESYRRWERKESDRANQEGQANIEGNRTGWLGNGKTVACVCTRSICGIVV